MVLVVAYDLHNPQRDYPKLEAALKAVDGSWAHPQGSKAADRDAESSS